jgi:uncharacterized protein YndB with AHSA1/START domain
MIDIVREIEATKREVGTGTIPAGDGRRIRMTRTYDAPIGDVWDALTNPRRIGRWFLPVTGDFRLGGRFQFEGNAGGEILACEQPNRLRVTWAAGDGSNPADISEVEVRLTASGDEATVLELDHVAVVPDEMWNEYGPGAVGVGWDGGLLGLRLHLETGKTVDDPQAWAASDEGRDFYTQSSAAWGAASRAAGADPAVVERNITNTTGFYAPPADGAG